MVYVEKKGRHWVPMVIMTVLVLCCTALFYAVPVKTPEPAVRQPSSEMPWFSVDAGIVYFDESQYTGSSQLTVPSEIDGADIVAIGEGCFRDCEELSAIILPDSLEAIGENAFRSCTALRGIEIPESVAFIGKGAFSGCTGLEAVCISNKLQHIGTDVFDGCNSLRYVYFLGNFQEWTVLYQGFTDQSVIISCEDGKFYQSGDPA